MLFRLFLSALLCAGLLAACGSERPDAPTRLLASGGGGFVFAQPRAHYAITRAGDGWQVAELASSTAPVTVGAGARLRFADTSVSLDIDGTAGQAYRLYKAAFNRTPDAAGLGFWIEAMQRGATLDAVARGFTQSAEYRAIYGSGVPGRDTVERLYQNVLGRPGEEAGIAFWTRMVGAAVPLSEVLAGFSESAENKAGVSSAIENGVAYFEGGASYVPAQAPAMSLAAELGQTVMLEPTPGTPQGQGISYAWSFASRPAGSMATLAHPSTARPSFVPDQPGAYVLSVVASDGATRTVSAVEVVALWRPAQGIAPATGSFAYFESQPGDPLGFGESQLYTKADSVFAVASSGHWLTVGVFAQEQWFGSFAGRQADGRVVPGFYGGMRKFPGADPSRGGLAWIHSGLHCDALTGWVMVDSVSYDGDILAAIDLRFEQHCNDIAPALRGRIRWSASDTTAPPGPADPPAGLWQPAASALPASGNYVYMESDAEHPIGQGQTLLYTGKNAAIEVQTAGPRPADHSGPRASFYVYGDIWWSGDFVGMSNQSQLVPGYYGKLTRYPFQNPAVGGLGFSGRHLNCNTLTGWFVIDHIAYAQGEVVALDARFEHHCYGEQPAVRGKVHWIRN